MLYHLTRNPFDPPRADLRNPEDIIIVGRDHMEALENIISTFSESIGSKLIILRGDWGTGKTAIIKKAIYELKSRLGDTIYAIHFRIPREGIDYDEFLLRFFIELYDEAIKQGIDIAKELSEELNKLKGEMTSEEFRVDKNKILTCLHAVLDNICSQRSKLLIVIDQLENLKIPERNYEEFPVLLREFVDRLGAKCQIVIVLSAIIYKLKDMYDDDIWYRFIRAGTTIKDLHKISKEDTVELFKNLLTKYREPEYRDKCKPTDPFTIEAIYEIHKLANGGIPGRIYDLALTILSEASRRGIEVIDEVAVRYLAGEYDLRWVDAIERMPYTDIQTIMDKILNVARELLGITYVRTDIFDTHNITSFVNLKKELREDELRDLVNSWKRGANYLVYYRVDEQPKVSIVKVTEKLIRSDIIEHLHKVLELSHPKMMERPIPPINISVVLVTGGRITIQARHKAQGMEVAFGIKVREKIVDKTEPKSYGRLRILYEDIREAESVYGDIYSIPLEEAEKLKKELQAVLRSLGILLW